MKNIAFTAHVDAGKTTLTERILFECGVIRSMGSVDSGTARTDTMTVERERGISVRSVLTSFEYKGEKFNLIDTPGHADFASQTERAFLAADGIVILVSAVDGVQSGTELLIDAAKTAGLPVIFFINKCDRDIARPDEVFEELKMRNIPVFRVGNIEEMTEVAAESDDDIFEMFAEGNFPDEEQLLSVLPLQVRDRQAVPVVFGSAQSGQGIGELLDAVSVYFPDSADDENAELGGVVFSVEHDKNFGRGAYLRIFSGKLEPRDMVSICGVDYKVSMIKQSIDGKFKDVPKLGAGDVGLVYGFTAVKTGMTFGNTSSFENRCRKGLLRTPLLSVSVTAPENISSAKLRECFEMMEAEDPELSLSWEPISQTLHIKVFGTVETEILGPVFEERFGFPVTFGEPKVIYKETPACEAVGFDAYTMPKPCWAVLKFIIKPLERGAGVRYRCTVSPEKIGYRYRKQVEASILPSLAQGLYGWEVTDIDIELVDGEDHPIHTHPLDFTVATPLALMDGLRRSGTVLLEPILKIRFSVETSLVGRIMSDVLKMRGQCLDQHSMGANTVITAEIPLAELGDYPVEFASFTHGKGVMTSAFSRYSKCPDGFIASTPRRGVDPLDRSKYILAARHAMSGTVFEV